MPGSIRSHARVSVGGFGTRHAQVVTIDFVVDRMSLLRRNSENDGNAIVIRNAAMTSSIMSSIRVKPAQYARGGSALHFAR